MPKHKKPAQLRREARRAEARARAFYGEENTSDNSEENEQNNEVNGSDEEVEDMPEEKVKKEPNEETGTGDAKVVENGEQPAGKRASLRPIVTSLKERVDKLSELTHPELDDKDDFSDICSEARKIKKLADELISTATKRAKANSVKDPSQYQYVVKVRGLTTKLFKDMKNLLQNSLGLRTVKFSSPARNSSFVDINIATKELMEKGVKILRNKPLGVTLTVISTKQVEKAHLPPELLLQPLDAEFDPMFVLKESLLRSTELTEEESNKMVEWQDKYVQHMLTVMCEKLDHDVNVVVKDRTDDYFFKLEKIIPTAITETESERFQTYSGINPDTDKAEMGYWVLGSDVRSRAPRTKTVRDTFKVITDFMESSDKPFYDLRVRKGYWNSVMICSNHVGECMVVLAVHSASKTDTTKDCEALKPQLTELFDTGAGKDCNVKSIFLKSLSVSSGKTGDWHALYGDEHVDEDVGHVKLRLYINTLFWSDGGCTEKLCQTIVDELGLDQETGVLGLGVSTGLLCMYLAKHCKIVCGVDRVPTSLPLALKNVELNDLKNVVLVQGNATTKFESFKKHFEGCSNVDALVLETTSNTRNKEDITNMRKSPWIKKVAYVVVSYKDVTYTLRAMCSKKTDSSDDPFVMKKVIPFENSSIKLRPDMLMILERASAIEDLTETRVPKTKPPKPAPAPAASSAGPPAKKMKLSPGASMANPRNRPKKFGDFQQPVNRGNMGRGYSQNQQNRQGFMPPSGPTAPWNQGNYGGRTAPPLLQFDNQATRFRLEEEAMLLERARLQKEVQLQKMQEVMLEAQRRRLAESLLPPAPPVQNIEEVVLSAIKKTGLLDKVVGIRDAPAARYNEPQSSDRDRWSPPYREQSIGSRNTFNTSASRYEDEPQTSRYKDLLSSFQSREPSRFRDRGAASDSIYKPRRDFY